MKYRVPTFGAMILTLSALATAQDLASFEKHITLKKLDNGLAVIICERPEAPPAGRDLEHASLSAICVDDRTHSEALEKRAPRERACPDDSDPDGTEP